MTYWGQKMRQEILIKFIKILNYIKSWWVIFVPICPDILITYISYKKNCHTFLAQKIIQEKLTKIHKSSWMIFSAKMLGPKIFELYQVFVYKIVLILPYCILLMRTKCFQHLSVKGGSIFFPSTSNKYKFHHLLWSHTLASILHLSFFLSVSALHFSNLLCQAKSLTLIVLGSSSSKLLSLSRLILSRSTARICFH